MILMDRIKEIFGEGNVSQSLAETFAAYCDSTQFENDHSNLDFVRNVIEPISQSITDIVNCMKNGLSIADSDLTSLDKYEAEDESCLEEMKNASTTTIKELQNLKCQTMKAEPNKVNYREIMGNIDNESKGHADRIAAVRKLIERMEEDLENKSRDTLLTEDECERFDSFISSLQTDTEKNETDYESLVTELENGKELEKELLKQLDHEKERFKAEEKRVEEERRKAKEKRREMEENRKAEERRRMEEEKRRIEEENRQMEEKRRETEEKRRIEEENRQMEEENRKAEERLRMEEEKRRIEEENRQMQEKRREMEEKRRMEEEKRRMEEENRKAEERLRMEEENRKIEEKHREMEENRKAEENRLKEERRMMEEKLIEMERREAEKRSLEEKHRKVKKNKVEEERRKLSENNKSSQSHRVSSQPRTLSPLPNISAKRPRNATPLSNSASLSSSTTKRPRDIMMTTPLKAPEKQNFNAKSSCSPSKNVANREKSRHQFEITPPISTSSPITKSTAKLQRSILMTTPRKSVEPSNTAERYSSQSVIKKVTYQEPSQKKTTRTFPMTPQNNVPSLPNHNSKLMNNETTMMDETLEGSDEDSFFND